MTDNRNLRKCYLENNEAPTLSVMKKYMKPALADVYFKSMGPKHKVIAGLEPALKGGGSSWYVSPKELLHGRAVMKPLDTKYLGKLGWGGLDDIAMKVSANNRARMESESIQALHEQDIRCKHQVQLECEAHWLIGAEKERKVITEHLKKAFKEFTALYTSSLNKLEEILVTAAVKRIKETKDGAHKMMQDKYRVLLQIQAPKITNCYSNKLEKEKNKLKSLFLEKIEKRRTEVSKKLHDINLEKFVAIEKLRHFLECEKIGCQIYVALKERKECLEEMESAKHKHTKQIKTLTKKINAKELDIEHAEELEKKKDELIHIWQKKVCHVVKHFQMFVSYCLRMLPEQADFFINMEKLLLLQLSEVLEKPSSYSIFECDFDKIYTPKPKPHPYYLFCEKNNQPKVDQNLCPKHCTSSASQLPVIIVNKRCIYSACDNFEQFTDKISDYINRDTLNDGSFEDAYDYSSAQPVNCTSSQKIQELKLESSLLQILQQEIANLHDVSFACSVCKIPHCIDCNRSVSPTPESANLRIENERLSSPLEAPSSTRSRQDELAFRRGTNWDSYLKYVEPKKCDCSKMAKKHLLENLPAYMRKMSYYDAPELLSYEPCTATELKTLVQKARGKNYANSLPKRSFLRTKEVGTQYEDLDYIHLNACFCIADEASILPESTKTNLNFNVVGNTQSSTLLKKDIESFIRERTLSLRRLIESPDVREIFRRNDCNL